jgi:cyclase
MRIIGKLEIKDKFVIKPIQFEGLRKVGDPGEIIEKFYEQKFDEILILNITGSLYGVDWMKEFVKKILRKIFIPVIIGGGIKSTSQAKEFFDVGVDKISLNTSIIKDFSLINDLKKEFGSQSVVCSIQANKIDDAWYAFTDMARQNSFIKVEDLIQKYSNSKVGEILVTSIRRDGSLKGVDEELIEICNKLSNVPIIYSGGLVSDDVKVIKKYSIDAFAVSSSFYYQNFSPVNFKRICGDL